MGIDMGIDIGWEWRWDFGHNVGWIFSITLDWKYVYLDCIRIYMLSCYLICKCYANLNALAKGLGRGAT